MMSSFFENEFYTMRLIDTDSGKRLYSMNESGIGHLRQSSDEVTRLNELQFGELWEIYVDSEVDVVVTDRVVVDGYTYTIKGVKTDSFGSINYKKMLLVKTKS